MKETKQLQVGDKITATTGYTRTISVITIDRVTAKRAFSGHRQFKREYNAGCPLCKIGGGKDIWNSTVYEIMSEDIEKQYRKQVLKNKLSNYKWSDLDLETLEEINEILKHITHEN